MERPQNISHSMLPASKKTIRLTLPWVNTSLVKDIRLYFLCQPLLWLLGLELVVPVIISLWLLVKHCMMNLSLRIPRILWWAIIFGIWQMLHIFTLPSGELDIFIKAQGTWLAVISLFLAIYNVAINVHSWDRILNGVEIFCTIVVILGFLYILGVANFEIMSLVGKLLPTNVIANSHFFSEISLRSLGWPDITGLPRVRSTFWHPSSYASSILVIFGIQLFQFQRSQGNRRIIKFLILILTFFNLIFTFSRTTYLAFLVMLFVIWWLKASTSSARLQKVIGLLLFMILILGFLFLNYLLSDSLTGLVNDIVYNFRPGSIVSRMRVYELSWQLVVQKPFWGWGTLIKLENLPSSFSAGSHSDYLNVLFSYGIFGLVLYLGMLVSLGRDLWKRYKRLMKIDAKRFLRICIALLSAMLIRQVTSELYWDLYVVSLLWGVWALGFALSTQEMMENQLSNPIAPNVL